MTATIRSVRLEVLHVSAKTNWSFVAVECTDGRRAWGEASLNAWEPMLRGAVELIAAQVAGQSPAAAHAALGVSPFGTGGLVFAAALSATQQALLSLVAAERGESWPAVLGGLRRPRVRAYANINRATVDRRPEGFAATARRAVALGFTAFKIAPFDGLLPALCGSDEGRRRIAHGIDCLLALRDAVGPTARVMVDCHWRFDEARAAEALDALRPVHLYWFECPLPETPVHWEALKRLRARAHAQGVRLAAAETQIGIAGFAPLFDAGLYDVVMPDVKYCGGPWEMLRIAEAAQAAGMQFSPHNPTGPLASLHSLAVAGAAPECEMVELQFDESPLFDALLPGQHPPLADGAFTVPVQAGWRPQPEAALFERHPYQPVPPGVEALAAG